MANKTKKKIKNPEYAELSKAAIKSFSAWKAAQKKTLNAKTKMKECNRELTSLHAQLDKLEDKSTALYQAFQEAESAEETAKNDREGILQQLKDTPEYLVDTRET